MAINLTLRRNLPRLLTSDEVDTNFTTLADALQGIWDSTGQPGGIAPLDANGRLPMGYAPYSLRLPNTAHDLNTYTAPGVYVQATSAGVSAGANYPIASQGWLEVIPDNTASSVVVMQRFTARASSAAGTRVFVRTQTGMAGSWVEWTEIPNFAGVFGYMGNMPDSPAPNLNDYTQRGIWIVGSSSTAANGANFPIGNSGVLLVLSGIHPGQAAGTTGIVQVYVAANSNRLFFRALVSNVWRDWEEAVRTSLLGAANGVATLDANKKVPQDQIPGVLGKSLGVADNLNDFDTPGTYYMNSNATALPELNYPVVLAGMLMVEAATGGNLQVTQLYVTNPTSNPRMFLRIRFGTSKTWGPWFELARFDQAMTHTYLTGSGVDMNKLTADNTYYTWNSSVVQSGGVNFPPTAANSSGSLSVVVVTASWIIQTCTMTPASARRPIVFQRIGNGSTTWGDWRVTQPISIASDLPTANCGDVYVDGEGWYAWNGAAYALMSLASTLPSAAHNLDDYTTPGTYFQVSAAGAAAGANYPVAVGGFLDVSYAAGASVCRQVYTVRASGAVTAAAGPRKFWRVRDIATWSPWQQAATTNVAMTHTFLTTATDANTLTVDNTFYSWGSATAMGGANWPPVAPGGGTMLVQVHNPTNNVTQTLCLNVGASARPVVLRRSGAGSPLTWKGWQVVEPISRIQDLPSGDCGDVHVDGVGLHRWNAGLSKYVPVDTVRAVVHRGPGEGSWITTVPQFYIDACAGGGGGGGGSGFVGDTFRLQGAGGGAGESVIGELITAPVGTLVTWSVGSGGVGGAGGAVSGAGTAGNAGTNTVITVHTSPVQTITLTRGFGGLPGATGGPALGGTGYPTGGAGFGGSVPSATTWPQSGSGGSSPFGGGGPGVASLAGPMNGNNGAGYGSGGGGGACPSTSNTGGKGGDGRGGLLKIYW